MTQIIRLKEVIERTGMKRSWIYEQIQLRRFPEGFKLGARARGWTMESIESWIAMRVNGK